MAKQCHYVFRSLKKVDVCNLINDLNELSWSVLDTFENPDEMLSMWITLVFSVVDQHAPVKSLRVKSLKKPSWLSDEILNAITERDELKKRLQRRLVRRESFNMARNKVVRLVNKVKKDAIIDELGKNSSNSRVLWKTLKSIFPTKSRDTSQVNLLEKNGTRYTSAEDMSNLLNEHFVSIADNIIEHNNGVDPDFSTLKEFNRCHKPENSPEFSIPVLTETEVMDLINSLPSGVATGLDRISSKLLKLIALAIVPNLAKVLNYSIKNGICPAQLKLARVTPIYKQGKKADVENYRPISVLPVLSKILEKHLSSFHGLP